MSARRLIWVLSICVVVLGLVAVSIKKSPSPSLVGETPGVALPAAAGAHIGEPFVIEDVTIFPVSTDVEEDPGPITSLQLAQQAGTAEVRELGSSGAEGSMGQARSGPAVNTLMVDNHGDVPVYVLAGTVVKGGNQDRQIGQDFIVAAHTAVPVDAFCVEHGRWTGTREGASTDGKFVAMDQLATSSVRVAGQYESNQGEVWARVAKVNSSAGKSSGSGTLMATLDDADLLAKRRELSSRVLARLAQLPGKGKLVGMAYAVNGNVRGLRFFASHRLFELFEETLANTAAADAVTARAGGAPQPPPKLSASDVSRFVSEVDRAAAEEKATRAGNVNSYRKAKAGYGSSTNYKPSAAAPAVPISKDYAAK